MSNLRRLVLIRHGETTGQSSIRFHGSSDVALSDEGRVQMREAARGLRTEVFDLIVASPLRRSWESARILSGGAPVRLEPDFREIDFGRWEGIPWKSVAHDRRQRTVERPVPRPRRCCAAGHRGCASLPEGVTPSSRVLKGLVGPE